MRCKYCYEKIEEEDEFRLKKNVGPVHTECDNKFQEIMNLFDYVTPEWTTYYGVEEE